MMSRGKQAPAFGRKHIFLTGNPGVGKTTAVNNCLKVLRTDHQFDVESIRGFVTSECRGPTGRVGFDVNIVGKNGRTTDGSFVTVAPLARLGTAKPTVGKYSVDVASFQRSALKELSPEALTDAQLLVVDEVGKMELFSRDFMPAVNRALDHSHKLMVFGTIPTPRYGRTIPEVEEIKQRSDVWVVQVTHDNRNQLPSMIASWIVETVRELPP